MRRAQAAGSDAKPAFPADRSGECTVSAQQMEKTRWEEQWRGRMVDVRWTFGGRRPDQTVDVKPFTSNSRDWKGLMLAPGWPVHRPSCFH